MAFLLGFHFLHPLARFILFHLDIEILRGQQLAKEIARESRHSANEKVSRRTYSDNDSQMHVVSWTCVECCPMRRPGWDPTASVETLCALF